MTEGAHKRMGFSAIGGRKAKAEKIAAILAAADHPLKAEHRVLDLGCGSGEIAALLASLARVECADAVDQRTEGRELPFSLATQPLPFNDASFDVVISNHVIEHTADPGTHLDEIRRILRPTGVAYLATPNRWWPWEVHAKLALLHYLPWRIFSRLGMALGRLNEPVQLLSLGQLQQLAGTGMRTEIWHHRLLKSPERFALSFSPGIAKILQQMPFTMLSLTAGLQPTLIVLLHPR